MLETLIAHDARTSAGALTALLNSRTIEGPALAAVLTHPNLPADVELPQRIQRMSADDLHTVLSSPHLSATRRERFLTAIASNGLLRTALTRHTDLSAAEIVRHASRYATPVPGAGCWVSWAEGSVRDRALALACNPNTPKDLAATALTTLWDTRAELSTMTLAVLADQHNITGAPFCRPGNALRDALAQDDDELAGTMYETASADLCMAAIAAKRTSVYSKIARERSTDDRYSPVRRALTLPLTPDQTTDVHVRAHIGDEHGLLGDDAATSPTLSRAALATMLDDPSATSRVMLNVAIHPACDADLRLSAKTLADQLPDRHDQRDRFEWHVAAGLAAGERHPALHVPMTSIDLATTTGRDVNASHVRAAIAASGHTWPPSPAGTTSLLGLLELHTGFAGTLLDALDVVEATTC